MVGVMVAEPANSAGGVYDPLTGEVGVNVELWESMRGTPPAYTFVPVPKRSNVDPGDAIHIDCYINGYGEVAMSKLQMNYPFPDLITAKPDKGEIATSVSVVDGADPHGLMNTDDSGETYGIGAWGATAILEPESFSPIRSSEVAFPQLASEVAIDGTPFLEITLITDADADGGNYPIHYTFTDGDEQTVFQSHTSTTIHVNNAREQREPWVTRGAIVVVLVSFISLLFPAWTTLGL